jgi:ferredoxin, 2Fe-2S
MRVDVLPGNFRFSVSAGQTVMAASESAGLIWPTVCGGEGTCLTCVLQIEAGDDRVEAPSEEEMSALTALPARLREAGLPVRLACQLVPTGDIVVRKAGIRSKI